MRRRDNRQNADTMTCVAWAVEEALVRDANMYCCQQDQAEPSRRVRERRSRSRSEAWRCMELVVRADQAENATRRDRD